MPGRMTNMIRMVLKRWKWHRMASVVPPFLLPSAIGLAGLELSEEHIINSREAHTKKVWVIASTIQALIF